MGKDDLVRKVKRGDKEALVKLIMLNKDDYYRLSYSYMKNEEDSMNMLQEMILKIYENIRTLRDNRRFSSWSKTILVNLCKDELKKREKLVPLEEYRLDKSEKMDTNIELDDLIDKLPKIYQEVIRLKYILGYDYRTIGEILSIREGTAKSRAHNGLKKLRTIVEEEDLYGR